MFVGVECCFFVFVFDRDWNDLVFELVSVNGFVGVVVVF